VGVYCWACGTARLLTDLLAFWPIGRPAERHYVCRPTLDRPNASRCFRDAVATADVHAIGVAA
jgi:hypothetical protein